MHNSLLSPRWVKICRDFWMAKGRVAMMVLAIAAGVFSVMTILSGYTILSREVTGNYVSTLPASASLELDQIDEPLLAKIRSQPGIAAAEARSTLRARIEVKKDVWLPVTFFVVKDFQNMQVSRFNAESGAVTPPEGSMLLEREALKLIRSTLGAMTKIKTRDGTEHSFSISGVVHDPSLAPAWQEQTAYAYITPATLQLLTGSDRLGTLKVLVQDATGNVSFDPALVGRRVSELAAWLTSQGHTPRMIRMPPPGQHPHQGQMNGVLLILLSFSMMALLLSAILTATMINAMLAQQVRQIGVMKAIGGSSWQIARLYLLFVFMVGALATAIGLPTGLFGGLTLANVGTQLFNINLQSTALPVWNYVVALFCGVLVPVLVAMIPIYKATHITVREAISDYGTQRDFTASIWIDKLLQSIPTVNRSFILALRNAFRRKGRLVMSLALLASAGALFIGTVSTKSAWEANLVEAARDRHYDIETNLSRAEDEQTSLAIMNAVPKVKRAESWKEQSASKARPDGLLIERTYPDGGHGSLALITVPKQSQLVALQMLRGSWISEDELDTVVLNNAAFNYFGRPELGSMLDVAVAGKTVHLQLVGVAREIMTGSQLYINQKSHEHLFGQAGTSTTFRIALKQYDAASIKEAVAKIEADLSRANISTRSSITETMMGTALDEHTAVLIVILLLMALLMAGVGALGLASAMGTSVVERTREFGIMRTIGGRSSTILKNLIGEAVLIGSMSCVLATALAIPLAMGLGLINRGMNSGLSLPILFSPSAALIWLVGVVGLSVAASAMPARRAARLSIRDTLAFV